MGTLASVLLSPGTSLGLPFPASAFPLYLLCCCGGLRKIIYAFGLGYGLSMFTGGLLTLTQAPSSAASSAACALYWAYGARLTVFLLRRQSTEAYNTSKHGVELDERMSKTPLPVKGCVTMFVSAIQLACVYALQPIVFAPTLSGSCWTGLVLSSAGLLIESIADEEKLAAKEKEPNKPVMTGSFSIVRHPNYTGEIIFWGGIAWTSLLSAQTWGQCLGVFGPCFMIWVMFGAAKRLDEKAATKYADEPEYKAYAARTGSLWPKNFS
eukprot:gnl/TRDRNA2_/TRDRNA2_41009_c0_seq1.p1 gnl/TRDRNA2_/TRDRNA2_41009_c0~~gnl/TRDRNA2_/TRDRNA2_41009_c0_seq1.p1  ORF type:complete len:267 (-),score=24.94 gnl/TRDRNA2_/TRDRNA2_41009_c0_seq1:56-856(-)